MKTQRKMRRLRYGKIVPYYVVVDGKHIRQFKTFSIMKEYLNETSKPNDEDPTEEQLKLMDEIGATTLSEAKEFVWKFLPISSSAFRILMHSLKNQ